MFSPGGSDVSRQEASDLLNKLVTEKTKVQAIFAGIGSLGAGLIGFIFSFADGTVLIKSDFESDGPFLRFDPGAAASFKYGDVRAMPDSRVTVESLKVASALAFIFPDMTYVSLFEIPAD